jgi:hypothetical protein
LHPVFPGRSTRSPAPVIHTGLSDLAFRRLVAAALVVSGVALLARSGISGQ